MTEPRPVYVTDPAHCGTSDRILYAAALLMLALAIAAAWLVWRWLRPLYGVGR